MNLRPFVSFDTASPWVLTCSPAGASDDFFAMVRPIHVDGSGAGGTLVSPQENTTQVWRWSVLGVSGDCAELVEMRVPPDWLPPEVPICLRPTGFDCSEDVTHLDCPVQFFGTDGLHIPTAVPMSRVPTTTPGFLPVYLAWATIVVVVFPPVFGFA